MPQSSLSRTPRAVWIGLAIAVLLDTAVQLIWKSAVLRVPDSVGFAESLRLVSREPLFAVLVAFFGLQFANWMLVLSRADLSFAQPITALSYVTVSGASYVILGEELPWPRMTGVALIVAGVWLVSSTDHRTDAPAGPVP